MPRIDAHCHFWDPGRGDYDWLDQGPAALDPLRRVFAPDDLAALNNGGDVIVVQAAESLAETRYLLSLAAQNPQIKGVVGWVDLAHDDAAQDIAAFARHPAFKGVRPMLQDLDRDDWIAHAPQAAAIDALIQHDLRFDALVLERHFPALLDFAQHYPGLPIVIDHCAKPSMEHGPTPEWTAGIHALAARPDTYCKLSGLWTELPAQTSPAAAYDAMRPIWDETLSAFGPARVMWGSDWPVLTLAADYEAWRALSDRLLADLAPAQRAQVLRGAATEFYGLGESA